MRAAWNAARSKTLNGLTGNREVRHERGNTEECYNGYKAPL